VVGRHADVDDRELRLVLADGIDELPRIARLSDDLEAGTVEEARQPFAQQDVVVGDDDTRPADRGSIGDPWTLGRLAPGG
jgi:hypothetical protein